MCNITLHMTDTNVTLILMLPVVVYTGYARTCISLCVPPPRQGIVDSSEPFLTWLLLSYKLLFT